MGVGAAVVVCRWCWICSLLVLVEDVFMVIGISLAGAVIFLRGFLVAICCGYGITTAAGVIVVAT